MSKNGSIGVFDSGVGGLSVMRELIRLMPHEHFIYLGDTARVPYGNKNPKTIVHYSIENTSFLMDHNIKLLVIACHTSCAHVMESLQSYFPIPIIGVIEPGFSRLMREVKENSAVILGTASTIGSGIYQNLLLRHRPETKVYPIACPLFVPLIEEGFSEHLMVDLAVKEYLLPLQGKKIDAALLACTHYPLISSKIRECLPSSTILIDPALDCAQAALALLTEKGLLSSRNASSSYKFYVTDAPEKFRRIAEKILQIPIPSVELKSVSH